MPGLSERPCRLSLLALAESAASATVTLRNETSGEYVFWTLGFTAAAAPIRWVQHRRGPLRALLRCMARGSWPFSSHDLLHWVARPLWAFL